MNNMKVFGIGLSKTGTKSLHYALLSMGLSSVHYPGKLSVPWIKGITQKEHMDGRTCFIDIPTPVFFKHLNEICHNAKFILTTRDINSWIDSCEKHFKDDKKNFNNLIKKIRRVTFGIDYFDKEIFYDFYKKHLDDVFTYFYNSNKLLTLDIDDYNKLEKLECFLNKKSVLNQYPYIKKEKTVLKDVPFHEIDNVVNYIPEIVN